MSLEYCNQTKNTHTMKRVYICVVAIYIIISLKCVSSYKFIYSFKEDTNSDILFFRENQKEMLFDEEIHNDYTLEIFHDDNTKNLNEKNHFFKYTGNNFVSLEELNIILSSNTANNKLKKGIIESSYELSYILKLTNDIAEIPTDINNHQFKCILTTLKYLKAVENNNMVKLFQALIFQTFVQESDKKSKRTTLILEELFQDNFFSRFEFSTIKNFLFAFLNTFMIEYIFEDRNLILVDKSNEYYDTRLINEHIPYDNLYINSLRILYMFDKILKNRNTLYTLQGLLNYFNMNSLILNNQEKLKVSEFNFNFIIFSFLIFKSITISNFSIFLPNPFIIKLSRAIRNDMEFLSLINFYIIRNDFNLFLKQRQLKGLILRNVRGIEDIYFIQECFDSSRKVEYIEFKNVTLKSTWLSYFFQVANVRKIIISFSTFLEHKIFISEFSKIVSKRDVLYLEIAVSHRTPVDFYHSLFYFQSLRTLKLHTYDSSENNEQLLGKAIQNMENLEFLVLKKESIGKVFYDYLSLKREINVLQLENLSSDSKTLLSNFISNNITPKKIFLTQIEISFAGLMQIFNLENLLDLTLDSCILHKIPTKATESLNFKSKKINRLNFKHTNLEIFNEINILDRLDCLESLNLSKSMVSPTFLERISTECNLKLKILSYGSGTLNSQNLNRIRNFEVLEVLNLSHCVLYDCSFRELGNECKFFNTLKILNLWHIFINFEDLIYLKNFRNLKNLHLTFSRFSFLTTKDHLFRLPVYLLSKVDKNEKYLPWCILNYLHEESNRTIINFIL